MSEGGTLLTCRTCPAARRHAAEPTRRADWTDGVVCTAGGHIPSRAVRRPEGYWGEEPLLDAMHLMCAAAEAAGVKTPVSPEAMSTPPIGGPPPQHVRDNDYKRRQRLESLKRHGTRTDAEATEAA